MQLAKNFLFALKSQSGIHGLAVAKIMLIFGRVILQFN